MPNFLHRTDDIYLTSTSPQDLLEPIANYIQDPDLLAVAGFPIRYWIRTGDTVTLMDQVARDAVDAAIVASELNEDRSEAIDRTSLDILTRELVEALLFEINKVNTRMQEIQDSLVAVKNTTGGSANIRDAIPLPSVTTNPAPTEFLRVNPKLRSEVLQAMVDDINAGIADP